MRGFFTQGRYFLLPADCADVAALCEKYERKMLAVTELHEEKCMAPYFTEEAAKHTVILLSEENTVYPCEVQVISQKEYNDRLREIIPSFCIGCPYYGGVDSTDESLEGHHDEVTLNSVCFHRAEAWALQRESELYDFYHVDEWIERFAAEFPSQMMADLVDRGEHAHAAKLFSDALFSYVHCVIPPVWFMKRDGKYIFYCTTFTDEHDGIVMEHICKKLTAHHGKTWTFYQYIPRGFPVAEAKKPLGVVVNLLQNVESSLDMTVYVERGTVNEAYYWLCHELGERELQKLATPLNVEEIDSEAELPTEAADADTLAELFCDLMAESHYDELRAPASHVIFLSPRIDDPDASMEERLEDGAFYSFRCSYLCDRFVMPIHLDEPLEYIWDDCGTVTDLSMPIARFVFSDSPLDASRPSDEKGELFKRETSEFFDYLTKENVFLMFAQVTKGAVSEQFGIVLNHTRFLYAVRRWAPMFMKYPAELYLYTATKEGGGHYELGFDMKLLEKESFIWKR